MRLLLAVALTMMASFTMAADLTKQEVTAWINSMSTLQGWLDAHEDKMPQHEDDGMSGGDMESIIARGITDLKSAGLYNDFNKEVKKAGFDSVEHWANTSQRVTMGYLALEIADQEQGVSLSQLEAQMKQVRESDLPEEQKKMMEDMMSTSLQMMKSVQNVSESDKAVLRPFRAQLAKQFDEQPEE